jgi:spermidine/putrescine transport system ATP-binding protein
VAWRPERVSLAASGDDLPAVVDRVVYLGTDLQIFTRLEDGTPFHLRLQNAARIAVPNPGDRVCLHLEEGASRLLAD